MLSKRYKSTEVDCRTWLHVPSGTPWSTSSDTHQVVKVMKKRLLLRCIHHFKSDLINNMDHIRISGTEPSSVILILVKQSSLKNEKCQIVPKHCNAKRDGVINPQYYNFNEF